MPPPDGGAPRIGQPRIGGSRSTSVTRSTPALDAATKWLQEIDGTREIDLGGVSELSQRKIRYGLEAHGRPVLRVTPYMQQRARVAAERYLRSTGRPRRQEFENVIDAEMLGVVIERIANAGGDLSAVWASNPHTPEYAKAKAKKYPGRKMGVASGKLRDELRAEAAFIVRKK